MHPIFPSIFHWLYCILLHFNLNHWNWSSFLVNSKLSVVQALSNWIFTTSKDTYDAVSLFRTFQCYSCILWFCEHFPSSSYIQWPLTMILSYIIEKSCFLFLFCFSLFRKLLEKRWHCWVGTFYIQIRHLFMNGPHLMVTSCLGL